MLLTKHHHSPHSQGYHRIAENHLHDPNPQLSQPTNRIESTTTILKQKPTIEQTEHKIKC